MIDHKIKEGMATIYKKATIASDSLPSSESMTHDFLVSTPAVITMIIEASSEMLDVLVPSEYVTVGNKIELSHEHPTIIGSSIALTIKVEKIEKNIIFLSIVGTDEDGVFCKGTHERAIVSKAKLLEIAYKRSPNLL